MESIDILVEQLKQLLPLKQEYQQRLDKKIRLEFNYNSNHIEGNTLTYGETELLLIFGKTTGNHDIREYDEMKAHDAAYELIKEWAIDKERPLTEMVIKNLHALLLVAPFYKDAITPDGQATRRLIKVGDYKEFPNSVRLQTGEIFHYASVTETPILMGELAAWYKEEESKAQLHPVVLAALFHYKFVRIHPFDDGNGRISRLLMNYILLKHQLPPVIIKSADKKNYLFALNQADTGDINAFVNYITEQLQWSLNLYIKAAKGEDLEEKGDLQKEIALLNKQLTSQSNQTKHPALVYDIYQWYKKRVWEGLHKELSQFIPLFGEIKEWHFYNKEDEIISTVRVDDSTSTKKIFGHDIYDFETTSIRWHLILYGLKGAKKIPDVSISASLNFTLTGYSLIFELGLKTLLEFSYNYGSLMLKNDFENLEAEFSKQLLEHIKEMVN